MDIGPRCNSSTTGILRKKPHLPDWMAGDVNEERWMDEHPHLAETPGNDSTYRIIVGNPYGLSPHDAVHDGADAQRGLARRRGAR
jgi:hypothetical protein